MTVKYLVNLGVAQLYFDAGGQRCAAPGNHPAGQAQPVYFERVSDEDARLTKTATGGLDELLREQGQTATLYKRARQ